MSSARMIASRSHKPVLRAINSRVAPYKSHPMIQSIWKPSRLPNTVAFSSSSIKKIRDKTGDNDLISKLDGEINFEKQLSQENVTSTAVKDYLKNGPFSVNENPGKDEVVLTRNYGQEKIQITFSLNELNMDSDPDLSDRGFNGEDEEGDDSGQSKSSDVDDEIGDDDQPPAPTRFTIVIEKPEKGALYFESSFQDGIMLIDCCYHFENAVHAYAKTPESLHQRQELYPGPQYGTLDDELQVLFERYLDERGINQTLGAFITEFLNTKEQKEYLCWLEKVKKFVKA